MTVPLTASLGENFEKNVDYINDPVFKKKTLKNFMAFLWIGFNCLTATEPLRGEDILVSHCDEETFYFLLLSPQDFLVLIWLTSERWQLIIKLATTQWFWNWVSWILRSSVLAWNYNTRTGIACKKISLQVAYFWKC